MPATESELIAFRTINSFVNDLKDAFDEEYPDIKLYSHLLSKTTLTHETAITKHVTIWQKFCITNRDMINTRSNKLGNPVVEYSEKVKVDFDVIFKLCEEDKETTNIIWKHILTISALLDLAGEARKILKDIKENNGSDGEADFLGDIITKIEDVVDPNADPMAAISSVMSSGIFTDLISGMGEGLQNGDLDINKLMGSVQTMVGKLDNKTPDNSDSGSKCPFDIASLMQGMANSSEGEQGKEGMPDISKLLGPMMDMMTKK